MATSLKGRPVGERHHYIYHLVQQIKNLEWRANKVAALTIEHELTSEELSGLATMLSDLDARRDASKNKPKPRKFFHSSHQETWEDQIDRLKAEARGENY